MKGTEVRETDLHFERNCTDLQSLEGNRVYVWIKHDLLQRISFERDRTFRCIHIFPANNFERVCSGQYILCFHTWVQSLMVGGSARET